MATIRAPSGGTAAADAHPDITWGKVDTQAQTQLADAYGGRSIPLVRIFRDGFLVFEQPGMLSRSVLETFVQKVRALDMDEVRRRLAQPTTPSDEGS